LQRYVYQWAETKRADVLAAYFVLDGSTFTTLFLSSLVSSKK